MNLRQYAQTISIEVQEARALCWSLQAYHRQLLTQDPPLTNHQLLTVKPTTRVLIWLARATHPLSPWPTYGPRRLYLPRPRRLRLEVDELLLLRDLHNTHQLPDQGAGTAHRMHVFNVLAKIDQKAVSLPAYFHL